MEIYYFHRDIELFLNELEESTRAKVTRLLEYLTVEGYLLGMPHAKRIEKDLYELRVLGSQNIRIFYIFHRDKIVLLHVISKKSNRLVDSDLKTARQRLSSLHHL